MKVIHTGDIHLDSKLSANLPKDKAKERRDEILKAFVSLVSYAKEENVSAILIAGDLFDTRNTSALSRNTFKNLLINNPDISFYYLRGNHDENTAIDVLDDKPDNLYLFNDSWTGYSLDKEDKVMLYGVELNGSNTENVTNIFSPDPSKINIVMLHGQDTDTVCVEKAETINVRAFKNKGINYLALGHVHAYKSWELDAMGKACYCGCLEGRGFDETGEHGFVVLDIDEEKGTVTDTFVPFAKRHLFEVNVDVSMCDGTLSMIEEVKKTLKKENITSNDLVKIVLTGKVDVDFEKDTDFIRHTLEGDYYFVKVYDKTEIYVDPKDYMLDKSLKGEFVRQVLSSDEISDEEKGEVIKFGLNALMGGKTTL